MASPHYEVQALRFRYRVGRQPVEALRGVSLVIERGAFVCLAGPSGSGKTTLLNVLGLIEPVQAGSVWLEGTDVRTLSERQKNHLRRFTLGFVFQQFHLLPVLSAEENVEYFLVRQGVPTGERRKRVYDALAAVGLLEQRRQRPLEMSGGQRQRVAVARALAKSPRVVIADEPTASLDQQNGRALMDTLRTLSEERGVTVLMASHDPMVHGFARTLVRLRDGQVVQA